MKHPRKRRPSRVNRWQGFVLDADETVWVRLARIGGKRIEVDAEFSAADLPNAVKGQLLNLYVHRRGRKARSVLRLRPLTPRTPEELERIRAAADEYARSHAAWRNRLVDA
jgi:hypothetical protein